MKVIVALLMLICSLGVARQATRDDATKVQENFERSCYVRKNGTSTCSYLSRYRLLKENKVQEESNYSEYFQSNFQKNTHFKVFVTNDGKKVEVPAENIQRAPVVMAGPMISPLEVVKAVIPGLKVGSLIEVEVKWENTTQALPGQFFDFYTFNYANEVKHLKMTVESELPLYVEEFHQNAKFTVKRWQQRGHQMVTVENTKPLWEYAVEENHQAPQVIRDFVSVGTVENWKTFAKQVETGFEATLAKPLPALYEAIVTKAQKETNDLERAKRAIAELADTIYYVQEYMGPSNSFFPRALEAVAKSRYGDCKDYSTALVAILRKLGWEAYVAIVESSQRASAPKIKYPNTGLFNHAIVYAKKNGQVFWLDPTQKFGYAEDISLFNAERPAVILTSKIAEPYVITPESDVSKHTHWANVEESGVKQGNIVDFATKVYMTGRFATIWTAYEKEHSRQETKFALMQNLDGGYGFKKKEFEFPKLDTWFYLPIEVKLSGTRDNLYLDTSAGRALDWGTSSVFGEVFTTAEDRISDLDLGSDPGIRIYERTLRDLTLVGDPFSCSVKSRWFDFDRSYQQTRRGIFVSDREILKRRYVTLQEMRSKEFRDFRSQVESCGYRMAIVFKDKEPARVAE